MLRNVLMFCRPIEPLNKTVGPLGKKRMETIDKEFTKASLDYLEKVKKTDKPFFLCKVGSFSLDQVLQTLQTAPKGGPLTRQ